MVSLPVGEPARIRRQKTGQIEEIKNRAKDINKVFRREGFIAVDMSFGAN